MLSSMPIHILSVMNLPNGMLKKTFFGALGRKGKEEEVGNLEEHLFTSGGMRVGYKRYC